MNKNEIPKEIQEFANSIAGGYFNTRVIKKNIEDETIYGIHEVYYDKNDNIWSYTKEPIKLCFENKDILNEIISNIISAATKPVLKLENEDLVETNEILWKGNNYE